jgi:transaldolase
MNQLEQLKAMTTIVADTGDFNAISDYSPQDTTTNPSLLLKAIDLKDYQAIIKNAIQKGLAISSIPKIQIEHAGDYLSVLIGKKILTVIPGRISTEIDARLSFDRDKMIQKSRKLIELYAQEGVDKNRVLIKIAATWEGIKAAEILEKENIQCNLTLLFSFSQAQACAEANIYLISPFVGRILDWFQKTTGKTYTAENDPGVLSVQKIYNFYKSYHYSTIVMGASFRSTEQVLALAGCDRLTISPHLMHQLSQSNVLIKKQLNASTISKKRINEQEKKINALTESDFRWEMNSDAMATEKMAEGIRAFSSDQIKLEQKLQLMIERQ